MELVKVSNVRVQERVNLVIALRAVVQATLLEWQADIKRYKIKSGLLKKIIELDGLFHKKTSAQTEILEAELLQLLNKKLPPLYRKIKGFLENYRAEQLPEEVSGAPELVAFQILQKEWQCFRQEFGRLEMKILNNLYHKYPLTIY